MAIKLLVLLFLLQVFTIDCQNYDSSYYQALKALSRPHLDNCNETECSAPCIGAAPPKVCPPKVPDCHFGCACHTDCDMGIVYCFQTKDCLMPRRFFTRRRRVSTLKITV
nr:uncharacterized protein LOC110373305 isoform X2 [Helicoverpa armigera]